ncbi:MAG: TorF family putative porin [Rhodospirillaceae bacterium]
MKARFVGLLATALPAFAPVAASAQDSAMPGTFTGNVAIVSDYVFRGITQSNQDPAIQGGLDWDSGAGIYFGTWASSIEFGNDASSEIDLYGGYRGAINNFTYDVGFLYYLYPSTSAAGLDFWEVYGKAGYNFGAASVTFGINYTPDNTGPVNNDQGVYYSGVISAPIGEMFSVSGGLGYSALEGAPNYKDWNLGATLNVPSWFSLDARYYDTDYESVLGTLADERFVFKISRTF